MNSTFIPPSLQEFLLTQVKSSNMSFDLVVLLNQIAYAGKTVGNQIRKAPFNNLLGYAGRTNVQDEAQKKLDIVSNQIFLDALKASNKVAAAISEEEDTIITFNSHGKYVVAMDPLDGSSNVDLLLDVGSIVAIWERKDPSVVLSESECLRKGSECVCCLYILYSAGTVFMLSTGEGVNGFTLNPDCGDFLLSHPNLQMPPKKALYSANEGNMKKWDPRLQEYVMSLKTKPYALRYSGAMVADVHRILLGGGIFIYPADKKNVNGKLRLLYELIPMAFLAKAANGKASTLTEDVLDVQPTKIHQRCPIFIGSSLEVENVVKFCNSTEIETSTETAD